MDYLDFASRLIDEAAKKTPDTREKLLDKSLKFKTHLWRGYGIAPYGDGGDSHDLDDLVDTQPRGGVSRQTYMFDKPGPSTKRNFVLRHLIPELKAAHAFHSAVGVNSSEDDRLSRIKSEISRHIGIAAERIHHRCVRRGVKRGILTRETGGVSAGPLAHRESNTSIGNTSGDVNLDVHDVLGHGLAGKGPSRFGELVTAHAEFLARDARIGRQRMTPSGGMMTVDEPGPAVTHERAIKTLGLRLSSMYTDDTTNRRQGHKYYSNFAQASQASKDRTEHLLKISQSLDRY